eukprot:5572453-Prymnesium_polylepis.1
MGKSVISRSPWRMSHGDCYPRGDRAVPTAIGLLHRVDHCRSGDRAPQCAAAGLAQRTEAAARSRITGHIVET